MERFDPENESRPPRVIEERYGGVGTEHISYYIRS